MKPIKVKTASTIPAEVVHLIAEYLQERWFDTYYRKWVPGNENWLKDFANLRLVRSDFDSVMKQMLFRDIIIRLDYRSQDAPERLARFKQLSRSAIGPYVQSVTVHLGRGHYSSLEAINEGGKAVFFQDLIQVLPLCVQNLPSLRSLHMLHVIGEFSMTPEELTPPEYHNQLSIMFATILTQLELNISELSLAVTCTHTVETIMKYDADQVFSQCRYPLRKTLSQISQLKLLVRDNSGPHGQRYYYKPTSTLLETFGPQEKYERSFFDFASMATNLEVLQISCTSVLNFDLFTFDTLRTLKELSLTNVKVSGENLMLLLNLNADSLGLLSLTQVELKSKTWEDILVRCSTLPSLYQVDIDSCGYARDGVSSDFGAYFLPPIDDSVSLECCRFRDKCALGDLIRITTSRQRELKLYDSSYIDERLMRLPTLASCGPE